MVHKINLRLEKFYQTLS